MAEALLPGTDAITKGTVEWSHYRGGYLVRFRPIDGSARQHTTKDKDDCNQQFWKWVAEMRDSVERSMVER